MSSPTAQPPAHGLLVRVLGPWVLELSARTWRADAQAALLVAVLVLPQAIAFAALAGLPPAWGLYGAIIPAALAALAGSSRHVISGPTNSMALALGAALLPLAAPDSSEYLRLALVLTLMVGLIQLAVALLRLGTLTHFIAPSVLLGFTTGAAVLIVWYALVDLGLRPTVQPAALAVGLLTLAVAVGLRWRWPLGPYYLVALVVGTLCSVALQQWVGASMARVGELPRALPPLQLPPLQWADLPRLATIALALTIVGLGQSVAIAKALAQRTGQVLDVNRECFGQGLANTVGAFCSSFVGCGSLNRSVPNLQAGARTPMAAVLAAAFTLLLVVVAAPLLAWVPMAAIGGVLLLVAWALVDRAGWRELWRIDRRDAAVAAGTAAATLALPLQVAVLAGVAASLVVYLYRTAHPALRTMGFARAPDPAVQRPFVVLQPGAPECPQLKLLRMEGPVWFGAEAHVADTLQALATQPEPQRHLLVMGKSMNFIDPAGAALWERERVRRKALGGDLYFHRPRPEVLHTWQAAGFVDRLGADHLFADKRSAIAHIVPLLDGAICARCPYRVFEECAQQPGGERAGALSAGPAAPPAQSPPAPAAPPAPPAP